MTTDNNMLVAMGNTRVKLSLFSIKSPGNLKNGILGKSRKPNPSTMNTMPRTVMNRPMSGNLSYDLDQSFFSPGTVAGGLGFASGFLSCVPWASFFCGRFDFL